MFVALHLRDFFIGALVERRTLLWGLAVGAFVLTFAFSFRHDSVALRRSAFHTRCSSAP